MQNEEERLYHQVQLQQQQRQKTQRYVDPVIHSTSIQSKKSKNKQKQSANQGDDKESCNIL